MENNLPEITREKLKERDRKIRTLERELAVERDLRHELQRAIRITDHAIRDYLPRHLPDEAEDTPELKITRRSR